VQNILVQIIRDKVLEVQARKSRVPLEFLRQRAAGLPKCRNFYNAVVKPNPRGLNVIAEVKKASPSAGLIRADFDPVAIARTYEKCGADAVSVLTDEKYFQGKLEYLTAVKDAVNLPVLRKDFIVDPYQVYEARAAGADAILLIVEALPIGHLMDLLILATELTMTTLIEAHQADTLLKVRSLAGFPQKHYSLLGINNRDLATMKVDLNTTARLADLVEDRRQLVSESGITTRQHVEKLIRVGVGAVLIGQTLCASENIERKFSELFGPAEGV
jgi:indole-3-glycerol phosphate synthase